MMEGVRNGGREKLELSDFHEVCPVWAKRVGEQVRRWQRNYGLGGR